MKKIFVLLTVISACTLLTWSCGKSDEDKENEALLVGTWVTTNGSDTMTYVFSSDATGSTTYLGEKNEFSWELKRDYLSTYYKKGPSYFIGYDKYNSRGYYKVNSITDNRPIFRSIITVEWKLPEHSIKSRSQRAVPIMMGQVVLIIVI